MSFFLGGGFRPLLAPTSQGTAVIVVVAASSNIPVPLHSALWD